MERTRGYRSLFWPLLLIGVGLVWLLGNLGVISAANLSVLARLWPLFLIAIGLDLLIGRRSALLGALIGLGTVVLVVALMLAGPSLGWSSNLDVRSDSYSAPLDDASSARVDLNLSVGTSTVRPLADSTNLIEADLRYVGEIDFRVEGGAERVVSLGQRGEVNVGFNPFGFFLPWNGNNDLRWDVGLSPAVPMALSIHNGVGEANLDLSSLQLTSLSLNGGVGEIHATLPATRTPYRATVNNGVGEVSLTIMRGAALDLTVSGGVGGLTIDVPDGAAVRLTSQGGLGDLNLPGDLVRISGQDHEGVWETDGFSQAELPITIEYNGGVGGLTVR